MWSISRCSYWRLLFRVVLRLPSTRVVWYWLRIRGYVSEKVPVGLSADQCDVGDSVHGCLTTEAHLLTLLNYENSSNEHWHVYINTYSSLSCSIYVGKHKIYLRFLFPISEIWDGAGSRNPSLWKPRAYLSCMISAVVSGDPTTQGVRSPSQYKDNLSQVWWFPC